MNHASLVFESVFPIPSLSHTTPTPVATPDVGYTAPGTSFGSPFTTNSTGGQHRAVRRNVAWSTATRFLSLPKDASIDFPRLRGHEVEEALKYLLVAEGKSEDGEDDIMEWYTSECRLHFANHVRPALEGLWKKELELHKARHVLEETCQVLDQVETIYFQPFNDHIWPILHLDANQVILHKTQPTPSVESSRADIIKSKFHRDIHAAFAYCLPQQRFSKTLSYVLYDMGCRVFRIYTPHDIARPSNASENNQDVRRQMTGLLRALERVGLGGEMAQQAFAHAMNKLIDTFITSHYVKVDWYHKGSVVPSLKQWIQDGFVPLVELVMECLRCEPSSVQSTEVQHWQEMALVRLGRARLDNLFDFVINWDKSMGAILDIREYLKSVGASRHLTYAFSQQLSRRLLHRGTPTTYILNMYISMIRSFHVLDPNGVHLDKVSKPIRRYLKERDDTARIIISSLLTDTEDEAGTKFSGHSELSHEIAKEMRQPSTNLNTAADDEINFSDLKWQPLPTDASPEIKKSKMQDVIWFLLTLWERDDFLNELKNILGDHLLKCEDPYYENEVRLLEMIKVRLGEEKLQACEVMLFDVLESKRINSIIQAPGDPAATAALLARDNEQNPDRSGQAETPQRPGHRASQQGTPQERPSSRAGPSSILNAQILSSSYWPLLREDDFRVPLQIETLQKEYESRYERIKAMRKLHWMNTLGSSTIALEFDDRTEEYEGLAPFQVSVVYAFQPQPGEESTARRDENKGQGIIRNIQQLEEILQMDESLIRQAISFWVGKTVLREVASDTYEVVESLSRDQVDSDKAAAAQELAEVQAQQQTGSVKSLADLLNEKKDIYISFITGMLTNQGNMPVMRICMMMRMMVQGGFPFGEDEIKLLLGQMEREGKVVCLGGDMWGIKKG